MSQSLDLEIEILEGAYKEVLDATKHQDDKIGRLFTGASFLTAATLSLAGLASTVSVTRRFDFEPYQLPLALFFLLGFLLLVLATVSLLIASFSTPLRIPGLGGAGGRSASSIGSGIPVSQLYFYDIAKLTRDEWKEQWRATTENDLKIKRKKNLLDEIHNLAVRTSFKYDRSTEAIALFVIALLTFAISAILLVTAMNTSGVASIAPTGSLSFTLALVVSAYTYLVMINRFRYDSQDVDRQPSSDTRRWRNQYVGSLVLAPWLLLMSNTFAENRWSAGLLGGAMVANLWAFFRLNPISAQSRRQRDASDERDEQAFFRWSRSVEAGYQARRRRIISLAVTIPLTLLGVVVVADDLYFWRLMSAFAVSVASTAPGLLSPTTEMRRRRREMQRRDEWAALRH